MSKLSLLSRFILCTLLAVCVTACVTSTKGGFKKVGTPNEMVKSRVAAAKHYIQAKDFEAARRHLKKALEIAPKSPEVHDAMALTFHYSGELELAERSYKDAIRFGKGKSAFRINYARFLIQRERFEEAEYQLNYVLDDSLYERREAALMLMGFCQQQLLKIDDARRSFERALVLNPSNTRLLRELAVMNFEAKRFSEAWEYLQSYRRRVKPLDAEFLLLGIKLASKLEKPNSEASFILGLKNLYPESREYQSYLRSKQHE